MKRYFDFLHKHVICLHKMLVAVCRRTWVEGEGEMGEWLRIWGGIPLHKKPGLFYFWRFFTSLPLARSCFFFLCSCIPSLLTKNLSNVNCSWQRYKPFLKCIIALSLNMYNAIFPNMVFRWCFSTNNCTSPIWSTFPQLRNSEHSPLPHLHQTTDHQPMFIVALPVGVAAHPSIIQFRGFSKVHEHLHFPHPVQ